MEITEINLKQGSLKITLEGNMTDGLRSVVVRRLEDEENSYHTTLVVDADIEYVSIDDLISILKLAKNYNFNQEIKNEE